MPTTANDPDKKPFYPDWSSRILLAAIAATIFLTLYPFRFSSHAHSYTRSSPLFLGSGIKPTSALDFCLNVLLFMPFGFSFCAKLRQKNWSWPRSIAATALAGGAFSYLIEFAQIYVPLRDSGWEDVISNSAGSLLGAAVYVVAGMHLLSPLSKGEAKLESWINPARVWIVLLAYFAVWISISIPLQRQTRIQNWDPHSSLFIGSDGSINSRWRGQVFRLEIWDHAIPDDLAREITSPGATLALDPRPVADYDFSAPPPVRDKQKFLPDLTWFPHPPSGKSEGHSEPIGNTLLVSQGEVPNLISALKRTNQFSIQLLCQPPKSPGTDGAITSLARIAGREDFSIWQQGTNLVFWFRSQATMNPWRSWHLSWPISGVFHADEVRDILITYDGANLSFFADGKKDRHSVQLGPGIGLANLFHRAKPGEAQIYNDLFYLAVFFPGGCLLGIGARKFALRQLIGQSVLGVFIVPIVFENIFVFISGRFFSYGNVALSSILAVAAALWINADGWDTATD